MEYVDIEYYTNTYKGESVSDADFPALLERASGLVEEMCMYRVRTNNMASFPEDTQERFRRAVCAQIEYLDANGGSDMDSGASMQSAGLGKFSYSAAAGAGGSSEPPMYAPRAVRILAPTGLLYRGGGYY